MIDLPPERRVELAKESEDIRLPRPPEIPAPALEAYPSTAFDQPSSHPPRSFILEAMPRATSDRGRGIYPRITSQASGTQFNQRQHSISNDRPHAKTAICSSTNAHSTTLVILAKGFSWPQICNLFTTDDNNR